MKKSDIANYMYEEECDTANYEEEYSEVYEDATNERSVTALITVKIVAFVYFLKSQIYI